MFKSETDLQMLLSIKIKYINPEFKFLPRFQKYISNERNSAQSL